MRKLLIAISLLCMGTRLGLAATPAKPIVQFSGHSETLVRYYQQEDLDRMKSLLALIEVLSFSSAFPRLPDLSVHFSGWGQVDMMDIANQNRMEGDLNLAYIAYRDPKHRFQAFLGRQYLYQNNKVLRFDGARVDTRLPLGLGLRVFGGFTVLPRFAAPKGYFAAGARLSHRVGHISEVGVSFLEVMEQGRAGHELLGFDASVVPFRWLEFSGSLSLDLHLLTMREANIRAEVIPLRWLRVAVGYEYSMPSAFISKNSIFSVFSDQTYHDAYAEVWFSFMRRRLSVGLDARLFFVPDTAPFTNNEDLKLAPVEETPLPTGEQIRVQARYKYNQRRPGWIGISFESLRDNEDGHFGSRIFWQQVISRFILAADMHLYIYSRPINDFPRSFFASLSGRWNIGKGWALSGSLSFTVSPFVEQAWLGLLKLSYRFAADIPSSRVSRGTSKARATR